LEVGTQFRGVSRVASSSSVPILCVKICVTYACSGLRIRIASSNGSIVQPRMVYE
jgi:hypothetical protein